MGIRVSGHDCRESAAQQLVCFAYQVDPEANTSVIASECEAITGSL
jgi:hypothetical protein